VTKDSSIVFARSVKMMDAVAGVREPPDRMVRPHLGCVIAIASHMPENTVEYTDRSNIEIESQFVRSTCRSRVGGQESKSSVRGLLVSTSTRGQESYILIISTSFPTALPLPPIFPNAKLNPSSDMCPVFEVSCPPSVSSLRRPRSLPSYLLRPEMDLTKSGNKKGLDDPGVWGELGILEGMKF
jgi:hypothetical protein